MGLKEHHQVEHKKKYIYSYTYIHTYIQYSLYGTEFYIPHKLCIYIFFILVFNLMMAF
jgi:hypothetical protein